MSFFGTQNLKNMYEREESGGRGEGERGRERERR
jgi:hypothetical protein